AVGCVDRRDANGVVAAAQRRAGQGVAVAVLTAWRDGVRAVDVAAAAGRPVLPNERHLVVGRVVEVRLRARRIGRRGRENDAGGDRLTLVRVIVGAVHLGQDDGRALRTGHRRQPAGV